MEQAAVGMTMQELEGPRKWNELRSQNPPLVNGRHIKQQEHRDFFTLHTGAQGSTRSKQKADGRSAPPKDLPLKEWVKVAEEKSTVGRRSVSMERSRARGRRRAAHRLGDDATNATQQTRQSRARTAPNPREETASDACSYPLLARRGEMF